MALSFDEFLAHYGVPGMKWGIRKDRPSATATLVSPSGENKKTVKYNPNKATVSTSPTGGVQVTGRGREVKRVKAEVERASAELRRLDKVSSDFRAAFEARQKHPSELSNQELQGLVARMDLEARYSQALARQVSLVPKPPPSKLAKTAKFTTDLVSEIAKSELKRVAKGAVKQKVNKEAEKRGLDLEPKKKDKGDKKDKKDGS